MSDGAVASRSSGTASKAEMDLKEFERYLKDATATIKKEKEEFAQITRELNELEADRERAMNPLLHTAVASARSRIAYADEEDEEDAFEDGDALLLEGARRRANSGGRRRKKGGRRASSQHEEELRDSGVVFAGYRQSGTATGTGAGGAYSGFGAPNIDLEYIGCDGANAWFGPYFGTPPASSSSNNWYFYEGAWFYLCPMEQYTYNKVFVPVGCCTTVAPGAGPRETCMCCAPADCKNKTCCVQKRCCCCCPPRRGGCGCCRGKKRCRGQHGCCRRRHRRGCCACRSPSSGCGPDCCSTSGSGGGLLDFLGLGGGCDDYCCDDDYCCCWKDGARTGLGEDEDETLDLSWLDDAEK